jgi:prepilin-type processing-associated H-X9-DG protein
MDNDYFICPSLTGEYSHDIRNGAYDIEHSPAESRHDEKANVNFCDGHAETMELDDLGYHLDEDGHPIANGARADNSKWTGTETDEP